MKITENTVKMALRYKNHHISSLASQLAFDMLFSFFPFLILLLTLVGFINVDPIEVIGSLQNIMPEELYNLVSTLALQLLQTRNGNLLSFSLMFSLYTASRAFRAIRYGLNRAYNEEEDKNKIKLIILSVLFMIVISFMIIFVLGFLVFGEMISLELVQWLDLDIKLFYFIRYLRYPIGFAGMIVIFTAIYKLIPSRRIKCREALPGAIFTSIAWIILSMGFAFYVNNYGKYTDIYGSIGVVIVLMVWLQITSTTILLGGELNALLMYDKENNLKI
ncbi:ribonuclease BN [Clostridium sulfidigenes]|uniref:Ribonuclease BN n=1 Tax=Clostridium sulfidigenes TaxID=318464 RepID=A0A084JD51_9CLOT|nr:YihY/virulence factor BrkB family protein [Clostridium sulfidigenes]KEZ86885.1 ribonuclease BN [Clostridium sulfidigenes]HBA05368.1 YihY/virulence factor BrkB family protein [Clostridium sp.]